MGVGEHSIHGVLQNEIEALVALGELERADELVRELEHKGRAADRAWHLAVAARGRALVAAARGDTGEALRQVDDALARHDSLPQPFELGRTLLVKGTIERRAKRRAAARESLTRAVETFDRLGAQLWAERAASELARVSGRGRGGGELTPTERRIAELVTEGRSNREIASVLFISVRTVEANLSKVYAKLGVHSRAELARLLSS
jgi:DNA-binding CsgD family transcriptional regulator